MDFVDAVRVIDTGTEAALLQFEVSFTDGSAAAFLGADLGGTSASLDGAFRKEGRVMCCMIAVRWKVLV